ncbi:MAG: isochorismatase, partial [Alphaproteobacteria bacterium]|nr:isochorismatase [Alphaproteobacteria bacterium]
MTEKDLTEDYAAAQFGGALRPGQRPALILVDFVMAYLDPKSPLYAGVESAFESAGRILSAARKAEIPVIFTNVVYTEGGKDGGVFFRKIGA